MNLDGAPCYRLDIDHKIPRPSMPGVDGHLLNSAHYIDLLAYFSLILLRMPFFGSQKTGISPFVLIYPPSTPVLLSGFVSSYYDTITRKLPDLGLRD